MTTIKTPDQLEERIRELQQQRRQQWSGLKNNVNGTVENLKPANLIRNAFSGITEKVDLKSDVLQAGVSLAAGMIINLILGRTKNKPLKKGLKVVLIFAITSYVAKHRDEIIEMGSSLIQKVKDTLSKDKNEEVENEGPEENEAPIEDVVMDQEET
jgi:hypothetical protein